MILHQTSIADTFEAIILCLCPGLQQGWKKGQETAKNWAAILVGMCKAHTRGEGHGDCELFVLPVVVCWECLLGPLPPPTHTLLHPAMLCVHSALAPNLRTAAHRAAPSSPILR